MNNPGTEKRLRRRDAAEFLTSQGFPIAASTLAKFASVGGGPIFESFGRVPLYRHEDLLSWARARSSGPKTSSSTIADRPAA